MNGKIGELENRPIASNVTAIDIKEATPQKVVERVEVVKVEATEPEVTRKMLDHLRGIVDANEQV